MMIKYGVVRMQDLARDVLTWDRFYLSGRLQKPVKNFFMQTINFFLKKSLFLYELCSFGVLIRWLAFFAKKGVHLLDGCKYIRPPRLLRR